MDYGFIGRYRFSIEHSRLTIPDNWDINAKELHLYFMKQSISGEALPYLELALEEEEPNPNISHKVIKLYEHRTQKKDIVYSSNYIHVKKYMISYLGISSLVELVGAGKYFEVWNPEQYRLVEANLNMADLIPFFEASSLKV
jgi:DNA-binding transcriptional regulator/RsmH inhibitor MraZ